MTFKFLGFVALAAALAGACSSKDKSGSTASGATCAPTDPGCPALAVKTDCLGLVDNSGKDHFVLRMSQLEIAAPKALTNALVSGLVGKGVTMNLPKCNLNGDGTFSLITEFDLKTGMLHAGGATPPASATDGYCYANDPAHGVAPVDVKATIDASLKFSTAAIPKITLPVYDPKSTNIIYLPLHNVKLSDGQISADHNCIGSYNATKLDPAGNCEPEAGINRYTNAAKLDGFITLEEADAVLVPQIGQTLCVVLSGAPETFGDTSSPKKCLRTAGKINLQGDWCSTSDNAGGCQDAFKLTAQLAASSAKLAAGCSGTGTGSGGSGGTM